MANAIEFDHVSKQYRLGLVSTKTLSHDIRRFWITNVLGKEDPYLKIGETNDRAHRGSSEYVWALRDIDFSVEQGDVVGIIGKNGAGKSTLLKLLSRVTGPTMGQIRAHGRIGSLLEVGTGFHSEMTGRENIFMNGAILGMTHNEIQRKLDEIIDFSGCERYIDTPVKRYSSGMMVRLGFAVAAHLDPEILVVDEVLAVGDAEFQKKAIGKMQDVSRGEGRTVLFVSHNMASVRALCNTGILLENGMVKSIGAVRTIIDNYLSDQDINLSSNKLWDQKDAPGKGPLKILSGKVLYKGNILTSDSAFSVVYEFQICEDNVLLGINPHFYNNQDICLFNIGYPQKSYSKGVYRVKFDVPGGLFCSGIYRVDNLYYSQSTNLYMHKNSLCFEIHSGTYNFENYQGVYFPSMITSSVEQVY